MAQYVVCGLKRSDIVLYKSARGNSVAEKVMAAGQLEERQQEERREGEKKVFPCPAWSCTPRWCYWTDSRCQTIGTAHGCPERPRPQSVRSDVLARSEMQRKGEEAP